MKSLKRLPLLFACLVPFAVTVSSAQDETGFIEKFAELKKSSNQADLEKLLLDSEKTETENPDFYALATNYWWGRSQDISISTKPPEDGDFAVSDVGKGNAVGSISTAGKVNPEIPAKALSLVQIGFEKFPHRLDLGFGLAAIQKSLKKNEALEQTLLQILEVGKKPESFKWAEDGKLPEEASSFVPSSVHTYVKYFFDQETDEDDARVDHITKKVTEVFPKHPYAWNMRAALASVQKDPEGILFNLEKAHELAPDDALILLNLADSYKKQKMPEKAREAAEKILKIESAAARHGDARAILESLDPPVK